MVVRDIIFPGITDRTYVQRVNAKNKNESEYSPTSHHHYAGITRRIQVQLVLQVIRENLDKADYCRTSHHSFPVMPRRNRAQLAIPGSKNESDSSSTIHSGNEDEPDDSLTSHHFFPEWTQVKRVIPEI